jgi:anti-anti-sigma factor
MPVPDRLSCEVQVRADGVHLIIAGEIDYSARDEFDVAVQAVLTGYPGSVVLDLTAVPFISSEGASSLLNAARPVGWQLQTAASVAGARNVGTARAAH